MLAEIGHYLLILATTVGLGGGCLMASGQWQPRYTRYLCRLSQALAWMGAALWLGAMLILALCFLTDDFSVAYVANHSNSGLPPVFKVAALWGSHEGSLLLWAGLLGLFAVIFFKSQPGLGLSQWLLAGFGLVIVFSANPFARLLPGVPAEGRDLNPVLQDIGLILHPPMLFIGYVFLCLIFVAVLAALWQPPTAAQQPAARKQLRTLTLLGWLFLTGGNVLGSWWAYNELGWGGWWFWDPVENAAFIPWLLTTALLHSLCGKSASVTGRSIQLLAVAAFGTCLLGSFLVRSGIVQSVHAFASSPERGASLLALIGACLMPALWLFALRHSGYQSGLQSGHQSGQAANRQSQTLDLGIVSLSTAALTVLLGTLYPLLYELSGLGKISVGAPYFNSVFVPLVWLAAALMGWRWFGSASQRWLAAALAMLLPLGLIATERPDSDIWALLGMSAACWLILAELSLWRQARKRPRPRARLAHIGVAISILGATFVSQYETEAVLRMGPDTGKTISSLGGDYSFVYRETARVETRAFHAIEGRIELLDAQGERILWLLPQRQSFKSNGMEMSQAGISHGLWQDFYVSMGQKLDENTYLIRLSIKPLVSWIWLGGALMMLAVLLPVLLRCLAFARRRISAGAKGCSARLSTQTEHSSSPAISGEVL
ncbi:cytochrome c biogenesis protein CcsA [Shewanella sp. 3B26]|uniref:Cytochrome c biogenesis protein CcsA n=1 Tax=Shewanella zhuhaiensis TaxID=2919576 RepID=A0AAJ1BDF6_9GAMM|nr:cytochrome c-type biogenesis CcmF C-terminal domain-containing protein [Shewanella zhuhaiensis]MCH4292751.1 cytochrome c biogenesis protein CcsA [Shewanella zhuhaiensis]